MVERDLVARASCSRAAPPSKRCSTRQYVRLRQQFHRQSCNQSFPRLVISGSSSLLDRILFAFVASYHDISAGPRQQAKKRTWFAAGGFCENRAYNKLAGMSVIMLHVNTVAKIFCTRLNRAITS